MTSSTERGKRLSFKCSKPVKKWLWLANNYIELDVLAKWDKSNTNFIITHTGQTFHMNMSLDGQEVTWISDKKLTTLACVHENGAKDIWGMYIQIVIPFLYDHSMRNDMSECPW